MFCLDAAISLFFCPSAGTFCRLVKNGRAIIMRFRDGRLVPPLPLIRQDLERILGMVHVGTVPR